MTRYLKKDLSLSLLFPVPVYTRRKNKRLHDTSNKRNYSNLDIYSRQTVQAAEQNKLFFTSFILLAFTLTKKHSAAGDWYTDLLILAGNPSHL